MSRSPHPRLPVMSGGREMRSGASARAYYNEIDPAAAHVLRCLIADGLIAPGDVDDRSIKDISPDDLAGYTQCHFFAGAGLWSVAARLAGWPDDRPLWTGSCPCQPFSAAGRGLGTDDPRHLWPDFFRLIRACRPAVVMGEQVAGSPGYGWFDGVRADLAGEGFASRVVDIPACAVDAPHIRQRLWWCAVAEGDMADADRVGPPANRRDVGEVSGFPAAKCRPEDDASLPRRGNDPAADGMVNAAGFGRREGRAEPELRSGRPASAIADASGDMADTDGAAVECGRRELSDPQGQETRRDGDGYRRADAVAVGDTFGSRLEGQRRYGGDRDEPGRLDALAARSTAAPDGRNGSAWAGADWLVCHDGKARRTEPGLRLLVDGMAGRVPAWRLAGNSISPVLAAEVIGAFLDTERLSA